MGIKKKAFFFTVDALLASAILLGGVLILSTFYINKQPTVHINFLSQDIINSLSTLKISEINNSYVNQLIAQGNITNLNNSILEQAGQFWAEEKLDLAQAFIGNVTQDLVPENYGFGIWISNDLIYQKDTPPPKSRASARKLVSGVEKQKPTEGIIANARAATFNKNSTKIIPFYTEGAGWQGSQEDPSEAVIDKYFEVPNVTITNATFYISVHIQSGGPDYEIINLNNGTCIIMKDDLNFIGGDGTFDRKEITSCLQNGTNYVRLKLRNLGYNAHVHPGMLIKIDYTINNDSSFFYDHQLSNKYYFDNIVSYEGSNNICGAWQLVPFFIPEDAVNISVKLHLQGKNILDYTGNVKFNSWDGKKKQKYYDYLLFVNGNAPFDYDSNPPANPVYDYSPSQLAAELVAGTNLIIVYFNNYGDRGWGRNFTQIYSDPLNDPENSSYLEVNYSLSSSSAVPYGSIEVTAVQEFGGEANWQKETFFSFPQGAAQMGNVFTHIVQQYSYLVDVEADTYTPPLNTVFSSPSARAVPTNIYIPKNILDLTPTANNYVRVSDLYGNDVLPYTSIEYNFYVPSSVGYGSVFSTQEEAEQDARHRLNQTLGDFISADNIIIESNGITGVPSLWGPAVMEVRVWH